MRRLIVALGLAVLCAAAQGAEERDAVIDRCARADGWSPYLGWEFPGAQGTVSPVRDGARAVLRLSYDFANGGNYVAAARGLRIDSASSVSFWVRQHGANGGFLRIKDATAQEHLTGFSAPDGQWTRVRVRLDAASFPGHWGGRNDGSLAFPLATILIGVNKGPSVSGDLDIRDLAFTTSDTSLFTGVTLRTDLPGGVAFVGPKAVPLTVGVENRVDRPQATRTVVT